MEDFLKGFSGLNIYEKVNESIITITPKQLKFNKDTMEALQRPTHVKVMVNDNGKQFALLACDQDDPLAIDVTPESAKRARGLILKSEKLMSIIGKYLPLKKEGASISYTLKGMNYPDEKVILYDLDDAQELEVKPRRRRKHAEESEDVPEDDGLF